MENKIFNLNIFFYRYTGGPRKKFVHPGYLNLFYSVQEYFSIFSKTFDFLKFPEANSY